MEEGKKTEGNTAYVAGRYQEAIESYTEALAINPKSTACLANRAACYLKIGRFESAAEDCNAVLNLCAHPLPCFSSEFRWIVHQSILQARRGLVPFGPLARIYRKFRENCADMTLYNCLRMEMSHRQNRGDSMDVNELKDPAVRADVLKKCGNNHYQSRRYQEAIEWYTKAINIFNDSVIVCNRAAALIAHALTDKISALERTRRLNMALEDATLSESLDSSNFKAYWRKGTTYCHLRLYSEAIAEFQKAVTLEPAHPQLQREMERAIHLQSQVQAKKEESAEMPKEEDVKSLRDNPTMQSRLADKEFRDIMTLIDQHPQLIPEFLKDPRVRSLVQEVMSIVDPSFVDRLEAEEVEMRSPRSEHIERSSST